MKVITKTDEYTIFQKRNDRYAVRAADRSWINGDPKVAILLEHKLIEAPAPKAPEPEVQESEAEAAAEVEAEATGEAEGEQEAAAEESAAEEAKD